MVSGVDFPGNKSIDNRKFTIKYYHKWAIPQKWLVYKVYNGKSY